LNLFSLAIIEFISGMLKLPFLMFWKSKGIFYSSIPGVWMLVNKNPFLWGNVSKICQSDTCKFNAVTVHCKPAEASSPGGNAAQSKGGCSVDIKTLHL